ncbi:MAG TPA: hypothetical protein VHM72_09960 [Solirubrobacteraceae bacterium]|nr:hypothetical protein [Solirubrobacteraceae bacterium]
MTYLPELHRILVEGAARLEHAQLDVGAPSIERPFPSRERQSAFRRFSRRRLLAFVGVALLASGSAAAALVALKGLRSAPPNGPLSSQAGAGPNLQLVTGSYSARMTPDLLGGSVGWCVAEARESVVIPVGNVRALRRELLSRRAQIQARLSRANSSLMPGPRAALRQEVDVAIPRLLRSLAMPVGERDSPAFRNAYRSLYGVSGGGASECGVAAQRGGPIVADFSQADAGVGGTVTLISTTTLVLVTEPQVAAVRVSPTLTLLTRTDKQLPGGERVAIAVQQSLGKKTSLRPGWGEATAVALDRQGKPIATTARTARLDEKAVYWQSAGAGRAPTRSRVSNSPPPGACEIDTRGLAGAMPEYGIVVKHVHGFRRLVARAYLSCASTDFVYRGQAVVAAILLDAQRPGVLPELLPNARQVSQHPQAFSIPPPPAGGNLSITARRVGDAWLVIQTAAPLRERLALLGGLGACVRIKGRCT